MGIFRLLRLEYIVAEKYAQKFLKNKKNRKKNLDNIKMLFELTKKSDYTIDDKTWDYSLMNEVFIKINKTCSSVGEAALYTMLRNPCINEEELERNNNIAEYLKKDNNLKLELNKIFKKIGFDYENILLKMITSKFSFNKSKETLYRYMSLVPLILILCGGIMKNLIFIIVFLFYMLVTIYIHNKECKATKLDGLIYLEKLLKGSKSIVGLESNYIKDQSEEIGILLNELKDIDRDMCIIKIIDYLGKFKSIVLVPFLIEEFIYYKINKEISDKTQIILNLYYLVGKLDAFLSVEDFKESNKQICSKPIFIKNKSLNINKGILPLLKNPVPNSIEIKDKGIILTGTSMSGKSAFLKMISINIILAQTFDFVFARKYEACFFYVNASRSHRKSGYYLEESENILRIINAGKKDIPVFCCLDELFKGINPMERTCEGIQVLKYMSNSNSLCISVVNDKEVCDNLKDNYDFYYFSDYVNKKDGLNFDYIIRKGVIDSKNTIKFLDYMGYPKSIIEEAYEIFDKLL